MKTKCSKILLPVSLLASVAMMFSVVPALADKPPCPKVNAIINPGNQTVPEASIVNGVRTPTVVTLDGTNSNPKNEVTCIWTSLSNPQIPITNPTSCTATFTAPDVGPLGVAFDFQLTVTETETGCTSETDSKTTRINITNVATNLPPVASATVSPSNSVNEGTEVTLDGSASSDPDGDTLTYAWTQTVGTSVTINNASGAIATFTAPPEQYPNGETLTFMLTVSDGSLSGSTTVNVIVNSVNQPPTAIISPQCPISVNERDTVTLDGSGSSDPDLGALTYQWSQVSGRPNADLTGVDLTASSITFTAPSLTSELHTMTFGLTVTDNGNLYNSSECDILVLDITPPAIVCGSADGSWHANDVSIVCTASDEGSGLANEADASFYLTTNVATETETANASTDSKQVCDDAKPNPQNCVTAGPITGNKIDKKAPVQQSCIIPDDTIWYPNNVTVNCTYTDGGSGPSSQTKSISTNVNSGNEQAAAPTDTAQACDNVANCATAIGPYYYNVDRKAPTNITFVGAITDGASYYFGFVPAAPTCTATDGGSGLESCSVTGYGTTLGTHKLIATAKDKVGNSSTAELSYTVLAWTLTGFYQPVDMNGVYNVVKNGSTVPLKFEIFAGSTELTTVESVKSLTSAQTSCDATAVTDEIEATATGGTVLRYDTTGGQFIYNWKTPSTAGKCYRVTMTTQDGSSLAAYFKLK